MTVYDSEDSEISRRLRRVLNSDRATLSPIELAVLQERIATALSDLMILEAGKIEFSINRRRDLRILELKLPVQSFISESESNI